MLARAIRRDPAIAGVRLIMLTSLGDLGAAHEIDEVGIVACMTKPVKQAQIRECLVRRVRRDRRQRAGCCLAP